MKAHGVTPLIQLDGAKYNTKPIKNQTINNFKDSKLKANLNITKNSFTRDMQRSNFSAGTDKFRSEGGRPTYSNGRADDKSMRISDQIQEET